MCIHVYIYIYIYIHTSGQRFSRAGVTPNLTAKIIPAKICWLDHKPDEAVLDK